MQVIDTQTDKHTHIQTQATTIPEGQNWPRVKTSNQRPNLISAAVVRLYRICCRGNASGTSCYFHLYNTLPHGTQDEFHPKGFPIGIKKRLAFIHMDPEGYHYKHMNIYLISKTIWKLENFPGQLSFWYISTYTLYTQPMFMQGYIGFYKELFQSRRNSISIYASTEAFCLMISGLSRCDFQIIYIGMVPLNHSIAKKAHFRCECTTIDSVVGNIGAIKSIHCFKKNSLPSRHSI